MQSNLYGLSPAICRLPSFEFAELVFMRDTAAWFTRHCTVFVRLTPQSARGITSTLTFGLLNPDPFSLHWLE